MKEKIKEFVHRKNYASFAELTRVIPGSAGERSIRGDNDSLVLWEGVSVEFAEAVEQLLRDNEIAMTVCDPMVYMMDRNWPTDLPVAKKIKKYPKAHWLPVTLCRP
jgi:hypothetical protein